MANKTLLNAVNEILKRVSYTAGDAGALTSLTDSARQVAIDCAVQAVNEGIEELYTACELAMPNEQAESTITLATATRAYTLATDLLQLRFPLIDKTNTQFIYEYRPGYNALLRLDPEENDTGIPRWGVIRPTDGKLYVYPAPTSVDNGKVYTYQYDKNVSLSVAASAVPFNDAVFRAMVPFWSETWKREQRQSFDAELAKASFGRASRLLTQVQPRDNWCNR